MTVQHTPGPWFFHHESLQAVVFDESHASMFIHELLHDDLFIDCNNEADARLVSAAPELLAALDNVLATIERDEKIEYSSPLHVQIVAAIAKAKGGAA